MDIVKFWKDQVDLWNDQDKCGLCFEFSAPLVQSQANTNQTETPCCVQVWITDIGFKENIVRASSGLITSKTCVDTFTLWVAKESPLGVNNYNEIKGHPIEESKWSEIFLPIKECLGCDNILDTCELLGQTNVNVDLTNATIIHNYLDNYNGWKVNYTFTQIT
jgi:hypothetical protein